MMIGMGWRFKRSCLDPLTRGSLALVTVGMLASTYTAMDRGEAALQLANFLPFFWLFATLPILLRSPLYQATLSRHLVLASIPINAIAIVEYAAKNNLLPSSFQSWTIIAQWQAAPHIGRAMVMFDHPNVLANYSIIVFGLGLGLLRHRLTTAAAPPSSPAHPSASSGPSLSASWLVSMGWWGGATFFNLVGLFCSGSRNGILIALSQLLLFILVVKLNRLVLLIGGLSLAGLGIGIAFLGLGTRTIGITQVMDDPRVGVWKIAFDLIQSKPWLGWGPGSFKFLYPPRLVDPEYQTVFHPHNFWLLLGAEYGILVTVLLTIAIAFICYRGVRVWWESRPSHATTDHRIHAAVFCGYSLALWGSIGFSVLDVTLYDARINTMNWFLLAAVYAWTLRRTEA